MIQVKRVMILALVVGLAATATACGGSKSSKSNGGGSTAVTISNEQGSTWSCGFNPFNSDVNSFSVGPIYEELTFVNGLQSGKTTDWLASNYAWSNGNKTLTFTIRPGVKWSDGKPMTAADVVFTFNLLKKYPALDLNAAWSVLKDVKRSGDKVTLDFKTAAVPYFYYIADQTPIVPQHIWASIKNPVTYKDSHPIGTGPFTMNSCTPQNITYTANPNYWQPGLPKIETVYYPAFTSNDPANHDLANGQGAVGQPVHPGHQGLLLREERGQPLLVPADGQRLAVHQQQGPDPQGLGDPQGDGVRDRPQEGLEDRRVRLRAAGEPDRHRHARPSPAGSTRGSRTSTTTTRQKAMQTLDAAGYKKTGDLYYTPAGKPLSFTMINIGGYSDWVASAQVVQENLKAVGIKVIPENLSSTTYDADTYAGKFQLAYTAT